LAFLFVPNLFPDPVEVMAAALALALKEELVVLVQLGFVVLTFC
jgi:hypothetical protein